MILLDFPQYFIKFQIRIVDTFMGGSDLPLADCSVAQEQET